MIFDFVWIIALDVFCSMRVASKGGMLPFPTIFALWNTWVHVCTMNSSNVTADIEAFIN